MCTPCVGPLSGTRLQYLMIFLVFGDLPDFNLIKRACLTIENKQEPIKFSRINFVTLNGIRVSLPNVHLFIVLTEQVKQNYEQIALNMEDSGLFDLLPFELIMRAHMFICCSLQIWAGFY